MEEQILFLAANLLEEASNEFSNHGCNDLCESTKDEVTDEESLCKDMQKWNGDPEWPEKIEYIGDSSLMSYLAYKLKQYAKYSQQEEHILPIPDIRNKLSPIVNLIKMIENGLDPKYIDKEIERSKISINYLADREVFKFNEKKT